MSRAAIGGVGEGGLMGGAAPEPAPPWGLFRGFPFLGHLGGSDFGDFRLHAPPSLFFRDCFRRFECSCPPSPLFSGLISLILVCLGTVFGIVLGDFVFRRSRRFLSVLFSGLFWAMSFFVVHAVFFSWTVSGILVGARFPSSHLPIVAAAHRGN